MSPEQLAVKGTESGHQKALFAWAAMAHRFGFGVANDAESYGAKLKSMLDRYENSPLAVPALRWLHAIPNGGYRDPVTAARMKAEGVKSGVADIFLPVARGGVHGLYIEMKKPGSGKQSKEQIEFQQFCVEQWFAYVVCDTWREAASTLQYYLT
jgi:hypothetical protein